MFNLLALENAHPNREANEDDMFLDKTDFFDDTLVDEDIISQHLESDLDLLAATLGPEYVQNIFSRSLKKKLPPEKTETN